MHRPCEPTTVNRLISLIVIERQSALYRFRQASPISPMTRDQPKIVSSIGWMARVQRRGTQSAIPIDLALFLQQPSHREVSAKNSQTPLTHFHITSQIWNGPCFASDSGKEVQLNRGNQHPWQPVRSNCMAELIECRKSFHHRATPIVRTHQRMRSCTAMEFVGSMFRSKNAAT